MNCLDFRRQFLADPYTKDPILHAHRNECAGCGKQAEKILQFESALTNALKVDPPENLNEKILMRETLQHRQSSRRTFRTLALAASIVVASVVAFNLYRSPDSSTPVDLLAIEHVMHDSRALMSTSVVSTARIKKVMETVNIDFGGELRNVTFAGNCRVNGKLGVHLVVAGEHGPVTILFLPGETAESTMMTEHDAMHVMVLPNSRGSTAIVGKTLADVETIESTVKQSVNWVSI